MNHGFKWWRTTIIDHACRIVDAFTAPFYLKFAQILQYYPDFHSYCFCLFANFFKRIESLTTINKLSDDKSYQLLTLIYKIICFTSTLKLLYRTNLNQKLGAVSSVFPGRNAVLDVSLLQTLQGGHDCEELGQVVVLLALPRVPRQLDLLHQLGTIPENSHFRWKFDRL